MTAPDWIAAAAIIIVGAIGVLYLAKIYKELCELRREVRRLRLSTELGLWGTPGTPGAPMLSHIYNELGGISAGVNQAVPAVLDVSKAKLDPRG